jgi:hypothetical protein
VKVYRVTFSVRNDLYVGERRDVKLWVIARNPEHAIRKARRHGRLNFDDKRARVEGVWWVGTIDVP